MNEEVDYIVEYYYDKREKLWRADVVDDCGNVVDFDWAYRQDQIEIVAKDLAKKYHALRVTKTQFYK